MVKKRSMWNALFTGYEVLNDNINYRRLYLIDVRNRDGTLVEKNFFIDETEKLQIGNLNKNEIICFLTADEKLENVIKFYPTREEIHFEKKRYTLGIEHDREKSLRKT